MKPIRLAVLVLAPLVTLSACAKKPDPGPPPHRAVKVVELKPSEAHGSRRYAGSLQPKVQVELPFKVGGRVLALGTVNDQGALRPLQAGDEVKEGDLLARLDPSDLRRNERAALAGLSSARAQASAAKNALAQAEREVNRARVLAQSDTISRADLDRAEAAYQAALSNLDAAVSNRDAKAAQYALAKSALQDAGLRSPLSAVVARRLIEAGEQAVPNKPAFVLVDTSELKVVFGVPDVRVNELRPGQKVPVAVDAFPGRGFDGQVTRIDPVADPALRSFLVEVTIPNKEGLLRAGMVGDVALSTEAEHAQLAVPLSSVLRHPQKKDAFAVYVVDAQAQASLREVALGDLTGNQVRVEQGLSEGDRVVVSGAQFLHPGERVEVLP